MSDPVVLVVHAVDTEGPLGGDARRLPDGSPEFFDNWEEIRASLAELTADAFRSGHADSFGSPYRFNWFVMDFTGFRTNPKCRVAAYHDTWDELNALPTRLDGLYWHYHVPPESGIGDEWSPSWLTSNEANIVLSRRLLERGAFPAAYRAGGTIEDDAASAWLEETIPIDFSNRISERSVPGADLNHFSWYGAPAVWGSYHPARDDYRREGGMRRFVYRSLDLRSRYYDMTQEIVDACFREVAASCESRVLSYFSHDNREMRPETYFVHELLASAAERTGVPWVSCTAVEAHQRFHGLDPEPIQLALELETDAVRIQASREPFQAAPFVAAELADGRFARLFAKRESALSWCLPVALGRVRRLGAAVTSDAGVTTVVEEEL